MASQNVEIIEGVYEVYASRDVEALLGSLHEDFEIRASEPLPWGGSFHGKDGMRDGKILSIHIYLDTPAMLEVLGK